MTEIPADIAEAAREAAKWADALYADGLTESEKQEVVDAIAHAIMDERDRCEAAVKPSLDVVAETARMAERARCVAEIEYVRENIRVGPSDRVRFSRYDLDHTFKGACTVIKEKITGEDTGKWTPTGEPAAS
ncbi:MAG TPA: hypothetical protein VIU82_22020 [Bosea sp. (in: a-proteobacteria)]